MDVSTMISTIQDAINDPAILFVDILSQINRTLKSVASAIRLPDLIDTQQVIFSAGTHSAYLPNNFDKSHQILWAYSDSNELELTPRTNTKALYKNRDRTTTGSITEVAPDGKMLWCYDGTTAKDRVRIKYYKQPDDLESTDEEDDIDYIPYHLHEGVLVERTIADLLRYKRYKETEKFEREQDKVILERAEKRAAIGFAELRAYFKDAPEPKPILRRRVRTF